MTIREPFYLRPYRPVTVCALFCNNVRGRCGQGCAERLYTTPHGVENWGGSHLRGGAAPQRVDRRGAGPKKGRRL